MTRRNPRLLALAALSLAALAFPVAARATLTPAAPQATVAAEVPIGAPQLEATSFGTAAAASDGTNFLLVDGQQRMQRVSSAGALLDTSVTPVPWSLGNAQPVMAGAAGGYLLAWGESAQNGGSAGAVYTGLVHSDLTPATAQAISIATAGTGAFVYPALARGSSGYLLVWSEVQGYAGSFNALRGQLLDASGNPSGSPFAIDTEVEGQALGAPAVAFVGGQYLVAWSLGTTLDGARVSAAGAVLDGEPLLFSTKIANGPSIAAGASDFLLLWSETTGNDDGGAAYEAKMTRVGSDGTALDGSGDGIDLAPTGYGAAAATYVPSSGFVVGWMTATNTEALATIDETTGAVAPAGGKPLAGLVADPPILAANGSTVLVSWFAGTTGYASLVGANATLTGTPVALGEAPSPDGPAAVACSGTGCLVAWQDGTGAWAQPTANDGTPVGGVIALASETETANISVVWTGSMYAVVWSWAYLDAVRVKQDGTVVDATPQSIDTNGNEGFAVVGGNGKLVEIDKGDDEQGHVYVFDESTLAQTGSAGLGAVGGFGGGGGAFLDATHLEVVWNDLGTLHGATVDVTKTSAAPTVATFASVTGMSSVQVARGASEIAVAVGFPQGSGALADVYRLDPTTGALIDGPHATGASVTPNGGSFAWDGQRYVLAWAAADGSSATASDLDWSFAVDAPLGVFTSGTTVTTPAIGVTGTGTALLVSTRTVGGLTSVRGQVWTSTPLGPPPADAGAGDASNDAGDAADAGSSQANDAGVDAGASDASSAPDAEASDAAPPAPPGDAGEDADGGAPPSNGDGSSSGCSCLVARSGGGDARAFGAAMIALGALARRRRRTRAASTLGAA